MQDTQDDVDKFIAEQNRKDGYTPAIVDIMLTVEKIEDRLRTIEEKLG